MLIPSPAIWWRVHNQHTQVWFAFRCHGGRWFASWGGKCPKSIAICQNKQPQYNSLTLVHISYIISPLSYFLGKSWTSMSHYYLILLHDSVLCWNFNMAEIFHFASILPLYYIVLGLSSIVNQLLCYICLCCVACLLWHGVRRVGVWQMPALSMRLAAMSTMQRVWDTGPAWCSDVEDTSPLLDQCASWVFPLQWLRWVHCSKRPGSWLTDLQ